MSFGRRPLLGLRLSAEPEAVHGPWCAISRRLDRRASYLPPVGTTTGVRRDQEVIVQPL